jgi:mono/diheme cytochrome c family protein
MRKSVLVVAVGVAFACLPPALASDAANGQRLAWRWCSSCHVVASDQRRSTTEAAPFSAIAHQPGFNEERLAFSLLGPHPPMPDMSLSRSEAADLAAYIATQK